VKRFADIAFKVIRLGWHGALFLAFAGCLTGCLVIPAPPTDSGYARTNLDRHTPEQFTPGMATREDVVLALGEPDAVSWDECQLAYRSEKVVGFWMFGGYGGGDAGAIYKDHFYFFEFDPRGRFQTVTKNSEWSSVEGMKQPQLNSLVFKSVHSNGAPAIFLGDPVRCDDPNSFWLAGVDGYRSKGAKSMVGRPGRLLLTESNLVFLTAFQFANAGPALSFPLASVAEARVDEWSACRLVVRLDTGDVHSFEIHRPGSFWQDKPALQAACDFIQSKIKPTRPEP
jgi:outer membrane protein assembly factor BamE (lipoprotein component of BamABCDE complex)